MVSGREPKEIATSVNGWPTKLMAMASILGLKEIGMRANGLPACAKAKEQISLQMAMFMLGSTIRDSLKDKASINGSMEIPTQEVSKKASSMAMVSGDSLQ